MQQPTSNPLLSVSDLHVSFPSEAGVVRAVTGVNFELYPGQTLGIVGESGSGKSVTSLAIMGLLPGYATTSGTVTYTGDPAVRDQNLLAFSDQQMSKLRGKDFGMIFQDPLSALTPVFTVGDQISEALMIHQKLSKQQAQKQAVELLDLVGIPNPHQRVNSFPHEFSGGMRQRVVIAQAIANKPRILIADEPTTALDVTIQAQILEVIKTVQKEIGAAVIMITHDMGVVAGTADEVLVMYAGRPVEQAGVQELFSRPQQPYTIGLLGSIPSLSDVSHGAAKKALISIGGNPPVVVDPKPGCAFAPRCPIATDKCHTETPAYTQLNATAVPHAVACHRSAEIVDQKLDGKPLYPQPVLPEDALAGMPREQRPLALGVSGLVKEFPLLKGALLKRRVGSVYAVNGLSFDIRKGECLAIVGESGCGKTTTLLEIMNLAAGATAGKITVGEHTITRGQKLSRKQTQEIRSGIQMVFQDPMGALDPRQTVTEIIAEPLEAAGYPKAEIPARVVELLQLVGIDPTHRDRFPSHFSGGQRQRIGLARALATNPAVIVLDEPVSALDVSIQAGMINLLDELKLKLGLSYLFVAHDLSVIKHISDRVAVMYLGRFVEVGKTEEVFAHPQHPYTQALLSAIPIPDPEVERSRQRIMLAGDLPSPTQKTAGCAFRNRCPLYVQLQEQGDENALRLCAEQQPVEMQVGADHLAACHHVQLAAQLS